MALPLRAVVGGVLVVLFALVAMSSVAARNARDRAAAEPRQAAPAEQASSETTAPGRQPREARAERSEASGRALAAAPALRQVTAPREPEARRRPRPQAPVDHPKLVRVRSGESISVRSRPGGRVIGRVDAQTQFGSKQILGAFGSKGRWLAVASSARTDGRLGWVDREASALRVATTKVTLRADLSERRIAVYRGDRVVDRARVAIGKPGSSTPTGRFAVTDKLSGSRYGSYYGCCILALSGTQPNLPAGWTGGNRLAIHGTNDPGSIGERSSAGCLRAAESDLRQMMKRVPLGTPVEIRR